MTETQAAIARTRKRVLLVDDDPGTLHVLSRGLGTVLDMFEVVTAHNGREAIDILKDQSIDALVTDLAMPVLDGFALIAHVTNMRRVLPLVVLSGMASGEVDERLSTYGGLRVLRKPASYQDVADQLLKAMEHVALGQIEGIPLSGILQLVESERRSCTVVVTAGRRKGRLHFLSGRLIDAYSEDFGADGEAAAYDILGWSDTAIAFERLPDGIRRTVHTPMQLMLIEIAVTQDKVRADTERVIPPLQVQDDDGEDADTGEAAATTDATLTFELEDAQDDGDASEARDPDGAEPAFDDQPLDDGDAVARYADGHEMPPSYDELPADAMSDADAADAAHDEATEGPALVAEDAPADVEAAVEAAAPSATAQSEGGSTVATTTPSATAPSDPHVASLLSAVERLSQRVRSADEALAAVTAEVAAFLDAQRAFDQALASRERRRRELEAFRDDVAGMARQILQRVDAMFSEAAPAEDAEARDSS